MIYFFLVKHVAEVDLCLCLLLELLSDNVAVVDFVYVGLTCAM